MKTLSVIAIMALLLFAPSAPVSAGVNCSTDMFGVTRCSNGQNFSTHMFRVTRDNRGNSWNTDMFGVTRGSDGSSWGDALQLVRSTNA